MDDRFKTYLPWFILREIPSLGNAAIHKLIRCFSSPENIFSASANRLQAISGIRTETARQIENYRNHLPKARNELERVFENNFNIVALNEPDYPALLKQIPDPPPVLTYIGTLDNQAPCISLVGARNATSYGLNTARKLSFKLAEKGFQVVSGLARGIDTMAHLGALDQNGKTIAVMGSGLTRIYPKENRKLFHAIARCGTVFSEFKVNAAPLRTSFPIRNRIIAGISCGTVVVEAAKKSGSLITARLANEYNREVFAVPGSIQSLKSQGTHALLKKGARLVETEMDIIDELYQFIHEKKTALSPTEKKESQPKLESTAKSDYSLLKLIDPYPVHIDVLIDKCNMDSASVTSRLLELELQGKIIRHPGNYYSISEANH